MAKMNRALLIILLFLTISGLHSQINFEPGYFIRNNGERVDCLIKNRDWGTSPNRFEYQLEGEEIIRQKGVETVIEFAVLGFSKYKRYLVDIDQSSTNFSLASEVKEPEFETKMVFLRVIIEGEANLYEYSNSGITRYFYSLDDQTPIPLIFKYYRNSDNKMAKNSAYRLELSRNLKCDGLNRNLLKETDYNRRDIANYFRAYHECKAAVFKDYTKIATKGIISLRFRPGFNITSATIEGETYNSELANNTNYRVGLELELLLPSKGNTWAVFLEPTYHHFNSRESRLVDGDPVILDYQALELPLGVRRYFYFPNPSKLSLNLNLMVNYSIALGSTADFGGALVPNLDDTVNLAFGLGFNYDRRLGLELRYDTSRDILRTTIGGDANYATLSFILGYRLL